MRAVDGDLLIRKTRVEGVAGCGLVDVRVAGGRVVEISGSIGRVPGVDEIDADGGWLVPGLHDHHIHLRALAASRSSVTVGPPAVTNREQLVAALRSMAPAGGSGWLRAVGYHESVAGELDRDALDRMVPDRPVRVQHRSGVLWVLNSAALQVVGADDASETGIERDDAGRPTGRLWRMDGWLSARTAALPDRELFARLGELSREAARLGVTGWTDATPDRGDSDTRLLERASQEGVIHQRLHLMTRPGTGPVGDPAGEPSAQGLVSHGAVKVILDDFDLPDLGSLSRSFAEAHTTRRPVAVHCVTRTQLVLTLAALEDAGAPFAGDRIEHGAVIPPELIPRLKRLGLTVVTQPNFVWERGDEYLRSVEPEEVDNLWRAGSLEKAGVGLAAGTDAPFGGFDPWSAVRVAASRLTRSGSCLGAAERVGAGDALGWWQGTGEAPSVPRRVRVAEVADLAILRSPVPDALAEVGGPEVIATIVAGKVVSP